MLARRPLRAAIAAPLLLLLALAAGSRDAAARAVAEYERAAQATGTIAGTITDAASGQPVEGAQVIVRGTGRGAVSQVGGKFTILEVPVGTHVVVARRIGYQSVEIERVVVKKGETRTLDVKLSAATSQLAASRIVAEAAPLVERGVTGSRASVSAETMAADASRQARLMAPTRLPPGAAPPHDPYGSLRHNREPGNTENYNAIAENPFLAAGANPLSTFSIDVDRASYANVRRFLVAGTKPPKDAVRIEELVNYFHYEYDAPRGQHPVAIHTELAPAPWKPAHRLLKVGLQGQQVDMRNAPPNNLVFLIDVSGSMMPANKLPLLKRGLALLVDQLREQDQVAIVVYAGAAGLVLPTTSGAEKARIHAALEALSAGGSTAGGAGIRLAYDVAKQHHIAAGNNRVILATDGDFNVGTSSDAELVRLVEEKRQQGTFLTVLGFGMGNYKDGRLEQLADKGNGNYAYIDNLMEAKKTLVTEMGGTLLTIAKDVKLQVEFNPARVAGYRLIGYENRLLAAEDFADDAKDAGELGAGHTVTALYEIVPVGAASDVVIRGRDSLRYQRPTAQAAASGGEELAFVKLRYKPPTGEKSLLLTHPVPDRVGRPSTDFTFASAVAAFGMLLRESEHKGSATWPQVLELARAGKGKDAEGYRAEFIRLVEGVRESMVAER